MLPDELVHHVKILNLGEFPGGPVVRTQHFFSRL